MNFQQSVNSESSVAAVVEQKLAYMNRSAIRDDEANFDTGAVLHQHSKPFNDISQSLIETKQEQESDGHEHNGHLRAPNKPLTSIQQELHNMQQEEAVPVEMVSAAPRIDSYTIARFLGSGAFGSVQLVTVDGNHFAMKTINHSHRSTVASTEREFDIHSFLSQEEGHQNVVKLISRSSDATRTMLFMEHMSGGSLYDKIEAGVETDTIRYYHKQLLDGIEFLHINSVVHLDIKPSNLLINDKNVIKICDFGLSQYHKTDDGKELLVASRNGTPIFAAPEVWSDSSLHGPPLDIWSAGVTLLAMFVGNRPWGRADQMDTDYVEWMQIISYNETYGQMDEVVMTLLRGMLTENVHDRATIDDCLNGWCEVVDSEGGNRDFSDGIVYNSKQGEQVKESTSPEVIQISSDSESEEDRQKTDDCVIVEHKKSSGDEKCEENSNTCIIERVIYHVNVSSDDEEVMKESVYKRHLDPTEDTEGTKKRKMKE